MRRQREIMLVGYACFGIGVLAGLVMSRSLINPIVTVLTVEKSEDEPDKEPIEAK